MLWNVSKNGRFVLSLDCELLMPRRLLKSPAGVANALRKVRDASVIKSLAATNFILFFLFCELGLNIVPLKGLDWAKKLAPKKPWRPFGRMNSRILVCWYRLAHCINIWNFVSNRCWVIVLHLWSLFIQFFDKYFQTVKFPYCKRLSLYDLLIASTFNQL